MQAAGAPPPPPDVSHLAGPPKRVVITGGSRGFGFALAQEFLRMGDSVALCGRDAGRLEAAVAALRAECGDASRVQGLPANCSSPQDVQVG